MGEAFLGHGGQDAVGAEFQVVGHAEFFEVADAVVEADRLADVGGPVVG